MKNLLITLLLLLSVDLLANELEWVDKQIQAIKPPRSAISSAKINAVKDPFIFLNKETKKDKAKLATNVKKTSTNRYRSKSSSSKATTNKISRNTRSYTLDAIINKSALINGKWYKINTKVGKYTLSSVNVTNVTLKYKNKELLLSTRSKAKKLKFKNN